VVTAYTVAGTAMLAAPALARDEGEVPAKGLGVGLTFLIFVGIPAAVGILIAGLVYAPSLLRRPRYRPGRTEWSYRPLWIGGPDDPEAALTRTSPETASSVRGSGASARW
jgi:hypothetical protein